MHEAWLIARREYVERIRSRSFRISTLLIPVAFAFIFGIGALSGKLAGGPLWPRMTPCWRKASGRN